MTEFTIRPIGFIRSELKDMSAAPLFYTEGAANARLELLPAFSPLTGVLLTRSPDRPNPLGLHRAKVLEKRADSLLIGPIEAVDGPPVVDIKPVVASGLASSDNSARDTSLRTGSFFACLVNSTRM